MYIYILFSTKCLVLFTLMDSPPCEDIYHGHITLILIVAQNVTGLFSFVVFCLPFYVAGER